MSKERLEEIEVKYSTLTVSSERDGIEYTEVDVKDLVFLIQNGFKQAERVQELEELIAAYHTELSIKNNANKRIKKKNKRYREALGFYADEENYEFETIVSDCDIEVVSKVLDDYGQKARNSLEESE